MLKWLLVTLGGDLMKKSITILLCVALTTLFSLSGCVPVIVAGAAVGANTAGSNRSLGTQVNDVALNAKAYNVLSNIVGSNVNVSVSITSFNGIILLLGQVPSKVIMAKISKAMTRIKGVNVVYNHLSIGPPVSLGRTIDDTWITTKVKSNFVGKVNPIQFKVITENGIVYLLALTDKATGDRAATIASKTSGVKKVVTCYVFGVPKPKPVIKR